MTVKQFLQTSILFTIVLAALGATARPVVEAFAAVEEDEAIDSQLTINNAEIEMLVDNTDQAISQVTQLTADLQGYVITSQTWYVDGFKHVTLKLGIPSNSYEGMLNQLYDLGLRVIKENVSSPQVNSEDEVSQLETAKIIVLTLVPQFITPSPTATLVPTATPDPLPWGTGNTSVVFAGVRQSTVEVLIGLTSVLGTVALVLGFLFGLVRRSLRLYYS
jgi:hypothetical protein